MYGPNQIIWDLDRKIPVCIGGDVWDVDAYPRRHTHFIKSKGFSTTVATPSSIAEAQELLDKGIIVPAPANIDTHCWQCGNWYNNCRGMKYGCSEQDKPIPDGKAR